MTAKITISMFLQIDYVCELAAKNKVPVGQYQKKPSFQFHSFCEPASTSTDFHTLYFTRFGSWWNWQSKLCWFTHLLFYLHRWIWNSCIWNAWGSPRALKQSGAVHTCFWIDHASHYLVSYYYLLIRDHHTYIVAKNSRCKIDSFLIRIPISQFFRVRMVLLWHRTIPIYHESLSFNSALRPGHDLYSS